MEQPTNTQSIADSLVTEAQKTALRIKLEKAEAHKALEERRAAETIAIKSKGFDVFYNRFDDIWSITNEQLYVEGRDWSPRVKGSWQKVLEETSRKGRLQSRLIETEGDQIFGIVEAWRNRGKIDQKVWSALILVESSGARKAFCRSIPFGEGSEKQLENMLDALWHAYKEYSLTDTFALPIITLLRRLEEAESDTDAKRTLLELQRQVRMAGDVLATGIPGAFGKFAWLKKLGIQLSKVEAVELSLDATKELGRQMREFAEKEYKK